LFCFYSDPLNSKGIFGDGGLGLINAASVLLWLSALMTLLVFWLNALTKLDSLTTLKGM
jgi:hypothetical protein